MPFHRVYEYSCKYVLFTIFTLHLLSCFCIPPPSLLDGLISRFILQYLNQAEDDFLLVH